MTAGCGSDRMAGAYGNLRASDADRDRTVDLLSSAFAEGRLTKCEHDARVQHAYSAATFSELAALSADLPAAHHALPRLAAQEMIAPSATAWSRTNRLAVASFVCGLIPGIPQIAAVILGIGALWQIRRSGERGGALAAAGIAISGLGLLVAALYVTVF